MQNCTLLFSSIQIRKSLPFCNKTVQLFKTIADHLVHVCFVKKPSMLFSNRGILLV
jgi:hypothetical protein